MGFHQRQFEFGEEELPGDPFDEPSYADERDAQGELPPVGTQSATLVGAEEELAGRVPDLERYPPAGDSIPSVRRPSYPPEPEPDTQAKLGEKDRSPLRRSGSRLPGDAKRRRSLRSRARIRVSGLRLRARTLAGGSLIAVLIVTGLLFYEPPVSNDQASSGVAARPEVSARPGRPDISAERGGAPARVARPKRPGDGERRASRRRPNGPADGNWAPSAPRTAPPANSLGPEPEAPAVPESVGAPAPSTVAAPGSAAGSASAEIEFGFER